MLLAGLSHAGAGAGAGHPVQRTILAVYDSHRYRDVRDTRIHRMFEMPLNHLGLVVRYHDLNAGLPAPESLPDVRGILVWLQSDSMEHPEQFLAWAETAIDAGKRFVVIGDLSLGKGGDGRVVSAAAINTFLAKLVRTRKTDRPAREISPDRAARK
jgi:hypothetical protein